MKQVALLVLLFVAVIVASEFDNKTEDEFINIRDSCLGKVKLSEEHRAEVLNFNFADEPAVHELLRCIWTEMKLWDEKNGFNVEHVAHLYKDKTDPKELIPGLTECNQNSNNAPPLKWLYKSFTCIMDGPVGNWFKEDVKKRIENV